MSRKEMALASVVLAMLLFFGLVACQGGMTAHKSSLGLTGSGAEGKITLAWKSNTDPYFGGYVILYGPSSQKYTNSIDVGKATEPTPGTTEYTLTSLVKGKTYFIAVAACSSRSKSVRSGYSNEVSGVAK